MAAGPDRFNLSPARYTFTSSRPNAMVAEPPLRAGKSMEPVPWLFEKWSHVGQGVHDVKLRPGVVFHDGTPFDAKSFATAAKQFIAPRDFIGLDPDGIEVVGPHEVRLRSLTRSGWMIDTMTHAAASVFRSHPNWQTQPIGTGPYRLVRYEPQERLTLERFDQYWGERPAHRNVEYRFVADAQARLQMLHSGEVDVIADVVPEMLASMEPGIRVHTSRAVRYAALLCNSHGSGRFEILKDARVRRALALAIDRERIAQTMFAGYAEPARGVLPAWMGEVEGHGYAPQRAAALLEQAGWQRSADGIREKDGRRLTLRLVASFPSASILKPLPEILERMFRAIGVETEIAEVEDNELYYSAYADRGQGDLFLELAGGGNSDPSYLLSNVFHSRGPWKAYHFIAPGAPVDSLLDSARQAPDREQAIDLVRKAHRYIVDEYVAGIPVLMLPVFVLSRPGLVVPMSENLDWITFGNTRTAT